MALIQLLTPGWPSLLQVHARDAAYALGQNKLQNPTFCLFSVTKSKPKILNGINLQQVLASNYLGFLVCTMGINTVHTSQLLWRLSNLTYAKALRPGLTTHFLEGGLLLRIWRLLHEKHSRKRLLFHLCPECLHLSPKDLPRSAGWMSAGHLTGQVSLAGPWSTSKACRVDTAGDVGHP